MPASTATNAASYTTQRDTILSPAAWNTERIWARFFFCQMNPRDPFGIGVAGDDYQYIFVSRESLDRYLADLFDASLQVRQSVGAENKCQQWLENLMKNSPERRPKTKVEFFQQSRENFGVTRRAFERAWGKAVASTGAEAWSKAGAPKKH